MQSGCLDCFALQNPVSFFLLTNGPGQSLLFSPPEKLFIFMGFFREVKINFGTRVIHFLSQ